MPARGPSRPLQLFGWPPFFLRLLSSSVGLPATTLSTRPHSAITAAFNFDTNISCMFLGTEGQHLTESRKAQFSTISSSSFGTPESKTCVLPVPGWTKYQLDGQWMKRRAAIPAGKCPCPYSQMPDQRSAQAFGMTRHKSQPLDTAPFRPGHTTFHQNILDPRCTYSKCLDNMRATCSANT